MKQSAPEKSLDIQFLQADLQSLASVVQVAKRFNDKESDLDILINNAGVSSALRQKCSPNDQAYSSARTELN